MFYDCLNEISVDFKLVPKSIGERELATQHLKDLSELLPNSLVLYDRGYASILLHKLHLKKDIHFCMRMPCSWNTVKEFIEDKTATDKIVTIYPNAECRKECIEHNLNDESYDIRLIKIILSSGQVEVLATSLKSESYDIKFFKELYHFRWNTEENYKSVKCKVKIEKFIGKTVKAIYQETYARMFMLNVASCLKSATQERLTSNSKRTEKKKHEYKISFKAVLSKVKNYGIELFSGVLETINQLIKLILPNIIPVRPNRKHERKKKNIRGFFQTYSDI